MIATLPAPVGFVDFRTRKVIRPRPVYVERFYTPDDLEWKYLTAFPTGWNGATYTARPRCVLMEKCEGGIRVLMRAEQVERLSAWMERKG